MVHVGSNRLAWQTSILPGHPLHTKGYNLKGYPPFWKESYKGRNYESYKGRKNYSNYLNLNPDPEGKVEELVNTGSYLQTGTHRIS
jgi:hypothetical protein